MVAEGFLGREGNCYKVKKRVEEGKGREGGEELVRQGRAKDFTGRQKGSG